MRVLSLKSNKTVQTVSDVVATLPKGPTAGYDKVGHVNTKDRDYFPEHNWSFLYIPKQYL